MMIKHILVSLHINESQQETHCIAIWFDVFSFSSFLSFSLSVELLPMQDSQFIR